MDSENLNENIALKNLIESKYSKLLKEKQEKELMEEKERMAQGSNQNRPQSEANHRVEYKNMLA